MVVKDHWWKNRKDKTLNFKRIELVLNNKVMSFIYPLYYKEPFVLKLYKKKNMVQLSSWWFFSMLKQNAGLDYRVTLLADFWTSVVWKEKKNLHETWFVLCTFKFIYQLVVSSLQPTASLRNLSFYSLSKNGSFTHPLNFCLCASLQSTGFLVACL